MEPPQQHHRCVYGPEVVEALVPLWEASDRLCGKRLAALLPLLVESLERHGHLALEPGVRQKLLTISSATIDRLLAPVRKSSPANGWRRPPRARSAVARRTPVRTFNGWGKVSEAGLAGDRSGGPLPASGWRAASCGTLVATDSATGWGECLPLLSRDGASVMAALRLLEELLPFPLWGIDVDNDGGLINAPLESWCEKHRPRIELTRSRAYQSNDQAWVEQKNGMLVRRVIGYQRLEGLAAAELLGRSSMGPCDCLQTCSSPRSSSRRRCAEGAQAQAPASSTADSPAAAAGTGAAHCRARSGPWRISSTAATRWRCWRPSAAARPPWPAFLPEFRAWSRNPAAELSTRSC